MFCLDTLRLLHFLQMSSVGEKLGKITNTLLNMLRDSCTSCDIAGNTIDDESFTCDPESPGYVTYRGRLEGTSERDSGSLISLIESWVDTEPNITVGGYQLRVIIEPVITQLPDPTPEEESMYSYHYQSR